MAACFACCQAVINSIFVILVQFWYGQGHKWEQGKEKSCNRCGYRIFLGGDKRDRTADLLNAIQALSQLSYTPKFGGGPLNI